jgi:hypothetical protein
MKTNNRAYHIKKCSAYKPKPKKQASRITEGFWGWNAINGSTKTSKLPKKMGVKISKANRERKEVVRKDS